MEHISQLLIKEAKHLTFGRKMALFILVLEDGSIARLGNSTVTKADRSLEPLICDLKDKQAIFRSVWIET